MTFSFTRAKRLAGLVALAMLGAAACSRLTIETSSEPDWSIAGKRSYSWRPVPGGSLGDPRINEEYLVKVIRRAADAELVAKGYEEAGNGEAADFEIGHWVALRTYDIGGPRGEDPDDWVVYGRPPGYYQAASMAPASHVEKGTIGLYLVDPHRNENVWRGEARSAVNFKASREKRRARVEEAVRRILGDLPAVSR
jgi:hypothetical protein